MSAVPTRPCELLRFLIPANSVESKRCRVPQAELTLGHVRSCGTVQEDCAQARTELLQLLPPEGLRVRETESEIVSVSELLLEQHETITSEVFYFNV